MKKKKKDESMQFSLLDSDLKYMQELFSKFSNIEQVVLFGSRAKGTHEKGSDVDLAVKGKNLSDVVTSIGGTLNEESPLPYYFDVLDYYALDHENLKEHIDRVGKVIYKKPSHF